MINDLEFGGGEMIELDHIDWAGRPLTVHQMNGERWYDWPSSAAPLVSCTTVINAIYGPPFPPAAAAAAEHAKERGVEVHEAAKLLCGGVPGMTLDWDSLDAEVRPRVEMLEEWVLASGWAPIHVERAFMNTMHGFACTPDQIGYLGGRSAGEDRIRVLDIKPAVAKTVGLQTAAQALAVKESLGLGYSVGRIALHIGADSCKPVELDKPRKDRDAFLSNLHSFRYGVERKLFK